MLGSTCGDRFDMRTEPTPATMNRPSGTSFSTVAPLTSLAPRATPPMLTSAIPKTTATMAAAWSGPLSGAGTMVTATSASAASTSAG